MVQKNKIFNIKVIAVLGVIFVGLALLPLVSTAEDQKIDVPSVEPIAQLHDESLVLTPKTLSEIVPSSGRVEKISEQAPTLKAEETQSSEKGTAQAEPIDEDVEPGIDYNTVLSFPITEDKVKYFVIAADKIDNVNRKWDMLISAAETDTMAIEYIALSNEEMQGVMEGIVGITVDEYNEIFKYSTESKKFRNIIAAFKLYYVDRPREEKNQASNSVSDVN